MQKDDSTEHQRSPCARCVPSPFLCYRPGGFWGRRQGGRSSIWKCRAVAGGVGSEAQTWILTPPLWAEGLSTQGLRLPTCEACVLGCRPRNGALQDSQQGSVWGEDVIRQVENRAEEARELATGQPKVGGYLGERLGAGSAFPTLEQLTGATIKTDTHIPGFSWQGPEGLEVAMGRGEQLV